MFFPGKFTIEFEEDTKNVPLETVDIPQKVLVVHLKAYGFVKVFRIVSKDGDTQHWVTDVQYMDESKREDLAKKSWKIEEYHRGIKPVSYTHLRAHETPEHLVCRLLLEKKKNKHQKHTIL